MRNRPFFVLACLVGIMTLLACTPGPAPLRVHTKGPRIAQPLLPLFLKYPLNKVDHGTVAFTLASDVSLTTGQNVPRGALLEGHYQVNYEQVLFSPAFISYFDSAQKLKRISIHSGQTARVDRVTQASTQEKNPRWFQSAGFPVLPGTLFFLDFRL